MKARDAIRACGLTVSQLAHDAGVSEAAVRDWLEGGRSLSSEALKRLAHGLRNRGEILRRYAETLQDAAQSDREG